MNYSDYKIEDWVTDDAFIAYVNGAKNEDIEKLKDLPDYSEKIQKATLLVKTISHQRPVVDHKKLDEIFERVNASIDQPQPSRAKILRMRWLGIAAAAVAIFVIAMPFFLASELSHTTTIAEQQNFNLPDNSVVELNSVSSIKYNAKTWEKNRYLVLEGEAFFDVEKGSTFMVSSDQGIVTVLGTMFNVKDREGEYKVECTEGKVEVAIIGGQTYVLQAGDRLIKTTNQNTVVERNVVQKVDWQQNFVEVRSKKVSDVLEEVNRYFDVEFENLDTLGNLSYSGFFSTTSLDSAMQQIFWPLDVEFEIKENTVIFK